jgi:hypothetical protein
VIPRPKFRGPARVRSGSAAVRCLALVWGSLAKCATEDNASIHGDYTEKGDEPVRVCRF